MTLIGKRWRTGFAGHEMSTGKAAAAFQYRENVSVFGLRRVERELSKS